MAMVMGFCSGGDDNHDHGVMVDVERKIVMLKMTYLRPGCISAQYNV